MGAYQRAERKCKELVFSSGEDKKNQDRMTDLASKLQSKIKTYKQQIRPVEFGKKSDRFCKNYWTSQILRLQKLPGLNSRTPHIKLLPTLPNTLLWMCLVDINVFRLQPLSPNFCSLK